MPEKTPEANADTLALLWRVCVEHGRAHVLSYMAAIVFLAASGSATAAAAWIFKPILNHMVAPDAVGDLRFLALAIAGLFTIKGLGGFGAQILLTRAGSSIVADTQNRLFERLLCQDMSYFMESRSSDFIPRLLFAPRGIADAIQSVIMSAGRDALTAAGLVAVMGFQDPVMTAVALLALPALAFGRGRLTRKIRDYAMRSLDGSARVLEITQETLLGLRIVKGFNLEPLMSRRMATAVREIERSANRVAIGSAVTGPVSDVIAGLCIGAVLYYSSWRIAVQGADPGSFFAFLSALLLAFDPCKRLARAHLDIQNALVGARVVYEFLDRPPREFPGQPLEKLEIPAGRVEFENVCFSYPGRETVLDGLDFVAEPNTTTALVGLSGGGKSTIINLVQHFHDVQAGRVSIDGQDVSRVDPRALREKIAFVSQDAFLFNGSIGQNIAMGKAGASQADIVRAAIKAHAHDFIMAFPDGYETPAGELGAQISGGQRQRIAIARAILKDAPIILLDEPTSSLDPDSEREVWKALDDLRAGRTTIVVSHRLRPIVTADRIYVIDNGKAVEHGVHSELVARGGAYFRLFSAQMDARASPASLDTPETRQRSGHERV